MSLPLYALTTVDRVKLELGLDCTEQDEIYQYLSTLVASVSRSAARYMNRKVVEYDAAIVEDIAGYGDPRIRVRRVPIVSLTSVEFVGTSAPQLIDTVDVNDVVVEDDGDTGILYRRAGWPWTAGLNAGIAQDRRPGTEERSIRVTYAGGWVTPRQKTRSLPLTVPEDVADAVVLAVTSRYNRRGEDQGIRSERLLSHSVTYNSSEAKRTGLPDQAIAMLRPHKIYAQA